VLFNSFAFLIFLPLVAATYALLPPRARRYLLLGASFLFYGWWDWRFLGLMVATALVDFAIARALESEGHPRRRLWLLRLSLASNLGVLGLFKYFGFFVDSGLALAAAMGVDASRPVLEIVLPVGISFYTFQALSYTIDVYRRRLPACGSVSHFLLFIAFFPQLVAGPIERASHLLPQLADLRAPTRADLRAALELLVVGFFKKVAVADVIALNVQVPFANPLVHAPADLLLALYLFSLQIYCDFSGYTDIARGSARLFGVELMQNFAQPYGASDIAEFWRRWHVSLSAWLRDYLYVPLGGNRGGEWRTYRNLMLTMLLGGLWHGASWNFVLWGGLHGLYLVAHRWWRSRRPAPPEGPVAGWLGTLGTFHLVAFAWIFFRSPDLARAADFCGVLSGLVVGGGEGVPIGLRVALPVALLAAIEWLARPAASRPPLRERGWAWRGFAYATLTVAILVFGMLDREVAFVYFQF
jgi:D-alanyl-lipoteichoic acid acyltransferase DltB (MBOAT superfamily)